MTHQSSDDAVVATVVGLASVAGALLGLSSLFGTRWWVNLIIVMVAAIVAMAAFETEPDTGLGVVGLLGLFALYGYVRSLGWIATFAVIVVCTVLVALLTSGGPISEPPAPRPPPRRATAPSPTNPSPRARTVSDETLERYARQFLDDGGARHTRAVVSALRRHISDERLILGAGQDLSWIASRALASTRSPAAPLRPPGPRQQAVAATEKPKRNVRAKLHEFGSFEIERAISNILDTSPGLTEEQLVDSVLAALGTDDRSPFALERLSDAIARVRGLPSPSAEERTARRKERRIARVPKRDPGGRTKLYEYGSPEIERVVEQLLGVDRKLAAKELHEAVLEVLGIEDRSDLGRQRVADAAAKISASLTHSPGAGGRLRRPDPKKAAAKRTTKKVAKKTAKKATKKRPSQTPPSKEVAKKTNEDRKKGETKDAARRDLASMPERRRETGPRTPPPTPAQKGSTLAGDEGAPGVKDIAELLGL